ncbi:zinc finger protein 91-like isoform X2 [Myripristis murdjan]|nr:zinc finger protein 91-like isoform X2 [Myripristis murdjan]XP_029934040.1 zinc finger protein 91-like isoform X2 [Myripristis murdjan]
MWQTVQQKAVTDYGLLDDFVTKVTEIVPGLLNHGQRALLSLGLRVQLILELCRPEQMIDLEAIQPHLDIIRTLTSLWNMKTSDSGDGSYGSNILSLLQTLVKDKDERQHFFKDVYPVKFGHKYNEDIQMLMEKFLLELEKLLIIPSLQQVACMLSDVPSVLAECVESFSHPQELKSLLEYQKPLSQSSDNDNPNAGNNICTALCLLPMESAATDQEDTVLIANVLTDYMDSFGKELTVETKDSQNSSVESEGETRRETESSCVENHFCVSGDRGAKDEFPCTVQHVESLHGDNMGLDSCGVEVQVGYNVEIPAEGIGCTENKTCVGDVGSIIATGEDEQLELSDRTTANNDYGVSSSSESERCLKKEHMEASNSMLTDKQMKNMDVSNAMLSPILYTPAVQVLTLEPVVTVSSRPVRQNRGMKMKTFLTVASKNEQSKSGLRGLSTSKTCPTCGKTYTRASDMRRHQRSHTGERPYQCSLCKKLFQFQYDLKRHELNVCRNTVQQPRNASSKTPEDKDPQDPNQCEVSDKLISQPLDPCDPVIAARSNCDSTAQCTQQIRTHKKACVVNQQHVDAPSGEELPSNAEQNDHQPCSGSVQLANVAQQNQVLLNSDTDATIHQENTGEEESEVVVRKPHGETCKEPGNCKCCGKTLAFPSLLEKHTEIHSGEHPYHCTICNKGYKSIARLKRHSDKCGGSSVHDDDVESQETITKLIQKPSCDRKSKSASPDDLVESTSEHSNQCSHKNPHPNRQTDETDCSNVCHLCDRTVAGAIKCPMKLHPDESHSCPNCDLKFKLKRDLKRHITACKVKQTNDGECDAIHQEGKSGKQEEHARGSKSTRTLGKHKLAENSLYCAECNRSFPDMARLKTHNLRHKPRPCTMCDESFKGFIDLNQHYMDVHNFSGPFSCTFCDRSYTDLKGLIRHERFHTGDLPFKCPKCPKAFSYASALKLHDRTHTKEAPFLCWDCGKGCKSNAALRIHRLCCHSSAEEKRFCCEHCGKAYALKRSLDLHVAKLHNGVRYPCSHCGKLFRSASSLTRHDLTHTEERPYSCNECGKSFRSASELKIHNRYHTGERPFKCQECGKGFVQSYYLTAHMRMHTGEKPYKCLTCDKCFKSAGILKRHQMTHTGEKPHKCSVCEMAFSRPELVKAHMRKSH